MFHTDSEKFSHALSVLNVSLADRCALSLALPLHIGHSALVRVRWQWLGLVALTMIFVGCTNDAQGTSTTSTTTAPTSSIASISTTTTEAVATTVAATYPIGGLFALVGGINPAPIPAAGTIKIIAADTGVVIAEVTTKTDGVFALSIPSGTYSLFGTTPQYQSGDTPCVLHDVTVPGPGTGDLLVQCLMK